MSSHMSTTPPEQRERGFEYKGRFYRWSMSDKGKDLQLIDYYTEMPVHEFFALMEDGYNRGRGPVLLAMIACSIRAGNPDWTVRRVIREVDEIDSITESITYIDIDDEEAGVPGPPEPAAGGAAPEPEDSPAPSVTSNGSPEPQSERLSEIPR
jgi:hypothetical protein